MTWPRSLHNATLLADGTVLVTGGSSRERPNEAEGAVLAPELWNPATETWSVLAPANLPRLYHSTAVLLPDGRFLSAGGGHPGEFPGGDFRDFHVAQPLLAGPVGSHWSTGLATALYVQCKLYSSHNRLTFGVC